jgi:hypothetical protein
VLIGTIVLRRCDNDNGDGCVVFCFLGLASCLEILAGLFSSLPSGLLTSSTDLAGLYLLSFLFEFAECSCLADLVSSVMPCLASQRSSLARLPLNSPALTCFDRQQLPCAGVSCLGSRAPTFKLYLGALSQRTWQEHLS